MLHISTKCVHELPTLTTLHTSVPHISKYCKLGDMQQVEGLVPLHCYATRFAWSGLVDHGSWERPSVHTTLSWARASPAGPGMVSFCFFVITLYGRANLLPGFSRITTLLPATSGISVTSSCAGHEVGSVGSVDISREVCVKYVCIRSKSVCNW